VDAPVGRSQHVLHVVPADPASALTVLGPALETSAASPGGVVLVLTSDPESAVALADVVAATHPDLPVVAVTTTARARRVVSGASVLVGTPATILGLVRATALKLETIHTLIVAWADLADPDLEALIAEISKEAPRTIAVESLSPTVETFVERYARRPRRVIETVETEAPVGEPIAVQYVPTAAAARPATLRRLLDDLDPPSALIYVRTDASERAARTALHTLGYRGEDAVVGITRSTGEPAETAQLVVLYDVPLTAAELQRAVAGGPVNVVALAEARELPRLRSLATATPLTLSGPATRARTREAALRDELRSTLAAGLPARELLALEPLLAEFDGVELAAAALRLLDRARATPIAAPAAAPAPTRDREERPRDERPRDERPREDRPRRSFDDRPPKRPFGDRPPRSRDDRPPRSREDRPPRSRDDRPPRSGDARPARSGGGRPAPGGDARPARTGGGRPYDKRPGTPRTEWTDRGERLTHSRRPPPRSRPDK
jgi:hypothetical protein